MRVTVTGGSGLIGTRLAALLRARGDRPRNHRRRTADKRDEISPLHLPPGNDDALSKGQSLALCDRAAREKWRIIDLECAYRTRCPVRVKSAVLTARPSLPVYPAKQTFSVFVGMSQTCHEATRTEAFAPAFRAGWLPGFPKKSPPCRQWIGNENPRRDLGARDRRSPLRRRMSRIAKGHSFGPAV